MTKLGKHLIESARQAVEIAGGAQIGTVYHVDVATPDVAAIRKRLRLSQTAFAERFGLSAATVRQWEQGRRVPDQPALVLLRVIAREPEAVARALSDEAA